MLVECPRCHFRQPQDQYCASCGVDMLAYKPKEQPFLTKLVKSGSFQFVMVVLLGVGVTWFVIRSDRPQQWIQKINRFASVTPNPQAKTEAGIAEDQQDFEAPPVQANTWSARATNESAPVSATAGAAMASADGAAAAAAAPTTQAATTTVQNAATAMRMLEVDNEYLNGLVQQAHAANTVLQDDAVKIFILPSSANISSIQNLNSATMKVILNEVSRANYGTANRGFSVNMSLMNVTNNAYSFRLQFNKVHPNDSQQIPADFVLRKGEKLVIAGNPLLSYFEFETDLANSPPFQIFKSLDYRNQKTTFAIVIELQ